MAHVTVLGAGMMGTAICIPLADRGHDVRLVGTHLDREIIASMRNDGVHPGLGVRVPQQARYFQLGELGAALDGAELIVLGVSSQGVRWAARVLTPYLEPEPPLLAVSKGLEWDGARFVTLPEAFSAELPPPLSERIQPVAIAGPCIAGELARRAESCVVFAGRDQQALERLAEMVSTDYYHVRCTGDVVGTEMCAALKNAYALAIGFAAGIHEARGGRGGSVAMHNYEAAVFSQALAEMRLLVALAGGATEAVHGLAGAGDLMVTCNGGRTGRFGQWLGLGLSLPDAIDKMEGATLESVDTIAVVAGALGALEASGRIGPGDLPLMRHLHAVVVDAEPVKMPFARFFQG